MKTNKKIDVHHHIIPQEYVEMLKEINITNSLGVDFPEWTPKTSFSFMKKVGADKVIASISSPGVYFKEHKEFSLKISRWCNKYMAQLKKEHPDKFGAFACIPLGFAQESVEELKYALDVLKLDGVCLLTHYDGKYLGDNKYDEFFNELNKRKAVVFLHPTDPADEYDPNLQEEGLPNSLIEVTFDTTRTVANMMYRGVLDKFKDIKYILAHGGGTLPYLAWRLSLISYAQKDKKPPILRSLYDFLIKGAPEKGLNQIKNMYYDTAMTTGGYALNTLNEFVGTSRIVFGSDFPFAKMAPIITKHLDNHPEFSNEDHEKIDHKNIDELFNN
ncbi:MAG: amidohydrolase [Maribacter sp.]|nr:amidohydrolase [Maribacter sp.]